jgi:colanic acid/amylovoran biosynthesis glycosyltransferase
MRAIVHRLGVPDELLRLVPIAAQLDGIAYREPPQRSGPLRVLMCGRLVEKKGHALAIRAFAAASQRLPAGSTLDLLGDGPLMLELRSLSARLGATDRIRFIGSVMRGNYLTRLADSDLVLAPSRTAQNGDGEGGAPTTILDAQATGVVVIGSTHADIPFLIEDGVTGYLTEEGSVDGLAEAIIRAANSASEWRTLAGRARSQVLQRHSDGAVSALLDQIYEEVSG